mmetsp:Transcript_27986/g.65313  ORF Transcript_27986/g.65313 Transcript_27986/m.65313 type:complete len:315 (+) Transcript_27986:178-1122(+)
MVLQGCCQILPQERPTFLHGLEQIAQLMLREVRGKLRGRKSSGLHVPALHTLGGLAGVANAHRGLRVQLITSGGVAPGELCGANSAVVALLRVDVQPRAPCTERHRELADWSKVIKEQLRLQRHEHVRPKIPYKLATMENPAPKHPVVATRNSEGCFAGAVARPLDGEERWRYHARHTRLCLKDVEGEQTVRMQFRKWSSPHIHDHVAVVGHDNDVSPGVWRRSCGDMQFQQDPLGNPVTLYLPLDVGGGGDPRDVPLEHLWVAAVGLRLPSPHALHTVLHGNVYLGRRVAIELLAASPWVPDDGVLLDLYPVR